VVAVAAADPAAGASASAWCRVVGLRPALRPHARIRRHVLRGDRWYVIQDRATGRNHRFSPAAHLVVSLMDGERTVEAIHDLACEQLGEESLTQDEMIRLLAQLHQCDVLRGDVSPDLEEIAARSRFHGRRRILQSVLNPLAVRLPLVDPDRFLSATLPLVRPLFSWAGLALFVLVTGTAAVLAAMHWSELTRDVADRVLATESLLLLAITYPFVKALHELGHGYAAKVRGAEVHEIGIMFLVFMPVPYVDASATGSLSDKWHRALVGSAGIAVELLLAACALFLWLEVEPGLVKAFAFNVMVIGGVSTFLFNGNPLLRFDGYYVLSDLIEIPNLGTRSTRYLGYLVQRYLFGVDAAASPVTARGEAGWFLFYGIASFLYRVFIMATIVLFVASEFPVVGVVLGAWAVVLLFVWPLAKALRFLFASPMLRARRGRAVAVTAAMAASVATVLAGVPVPYGTVTEGVVWAGRDSVVHAGTDGVFDELLVPPDTVVAAGQPLARMRDPLLSARVRVVAAELEELRLRHTALKVMNAVEARVVAEKIRHAEAELALGREREREMTVRSPADGRLLVGEPEDLVGRFLHKGQSMGYVADLRAPTVLVVVPHSAIDLVRDRTRDVRVRFADRFDEVLPASVVRELPFVTEQVPTLALTTLGGGELAVDPSDPSGRKTLEAQYQLELEVAVPHDVAGMGSRAYVRFGHGSEPLGRQLYRQVRQLFLRRFSI
jgi:putative peptide zinc metalloprotease protein